MINENEQVKKPNENEEVPSYLTVDDLVMEVGQFYVKEMNYKIHIKKLEESVKQLSEVNNSMTEKVNKYKYSIDAADIRIKSLVENTEINNKKMAELNHLIKEKDQIISELQEKLLNSEEKLKDLEREIELQKTTIKGSTTKKKTKK